jgi:hypothetical protein
MAAPDAELLLDALHTAQAALYGSGDAVGVERLLDPGIVWQVPGQNLIAGTYQRVEEVIGYMLRRRELDVSSRSPMRPRSSGLPRRDREHSLRVLTYAQSASARSDDDRGSDFGARPTG